MQHATKPIFYCAPGFVRYSGPLDWTDKTVNSELCKKALEKVGNPNVLINLVSRRVRS